MNIKWFDLSWAEPVPKAVPPLPLPLGQMRATQNANLNPLEFM